MRTFNNGDRVRWKEQDDTNDADDPSRYTPVVREGTVVEVKPAAEVYRKPPEYHPGFLRRRPGDAKPTKFPAGTVVLRVAVDGARAGGKGPTHANVHESQVL